jgi:hypothetical protein
MGLLKINKNLSSSFFCLLSGKQFEDVLKTTIKETYSGQKFISVTAKAPDVITFIFPVLK